MEGQRNGKKLGKKEPIDIGTLGLISPEEIEVTGDASSVQIKVCSLVDHTPLETITFRLHEGKDFPREKFTKFFRYFAEKAHYLLLTAKDNPELTGYGIILELGNIVGHGLDAAGMEKGIPLDITYKTLEADTYLWTANPVKKKIEESAEAVEKVFDETEETETYGLNRLVEMYHNPPNLNFRQWVSEAISKLNPSPAEIEGFIETFKGENSKIQRFILKALAHSKEEKVTDFLIDALSDAPDEETRWLAALYLSERKLTPADLEKIGPYLKKHTRKGKLNSLMNTFCILRNDAFNDSGYRDAIIKNLKTLDTGSLSIAISNMPEWVNEDAALEILNRYADHVSPAIRETVLDSAMRMPAAGEIIKILENDPDTIIRQKIDHHRAVKGKEKLPSFNRDKALGILAGAAVGDAVGAQVEFLSRKEILDIYGREVDDYMDLKKHGQKLRIRPGEVTDDTAMGLMILDAYLERGFFDVSVMGRNFGREITKVDKAGKPNIGYPAKSSMDMRKLMLGCNWRLSGHDANGCGAAMRAFAIPLFSADEEELRRNSQNSAIVTHNSDMGLASAYAVAKTIDMIMRSTEDISSENLLTTVSDAISHIEKTLSDKIAGLKKLLSLPVQEGLSRIGTNGDAIETVPAAIYCFLKSPTDYLETLRNSCNVDGDSDSIACIAGAMSGAYNGINGIPKNLLKGLRDYPELEKRVKSLEKLLKK